MKTSFESKSLKQAKTPSKNANARCAGMTKKGQKASVKAGALRTDMAAELLNVSGSDTDCEQIKKSKIKVDKAISLKINKPIGTYITLESCVVKKGRIDMYKDLSMAIADSINELLINELALQSEQNTKTSVKPALNVSNFDRLATDKADKSAKNVGKVNTKRNVAVGIKSVLVVCLGNPNLTADALGAKVFDSLTITRHLPGSDGVSVSALCPNVMGATGIESFDIIKGVIERVRPQLVIAVDSLASAAVGRIASAFQLCSSGITPGSGVANHRIRLDKSSLGVNVLSIGVPLVVYATTIIAEAAGGGAAQSADDEIQNLIVTPKDIDLLVDECAKVIAGGINRCFVG